MGGGSVHTASASELLEQLSAERQGLPFLVYRDGDGAQRIVTLDGDGDGGRWTIGRAPENTVSVEWDARVSRVHAELNRIGSDWIVDDDGLSRNGTYVNGTKLIRRQRLEDGDVIRVGGVHLRFRLPLVHAVGTTVIDTEEPVETTVSPAQRRVLIALCRPLANTSEYATTATNQAIADELFLTVDAVKTHLRALFTRFGVADLPQNTKRGALAARAMLSGVVKVEEITAGNG